MTTETAARPGGTPLSPTAAPVVTGIGVTAPNGLGTEAWWAAVLRGESGIRPVGRFDATQYPAKLAGEVPGFDAAEHVPSRLLPQTDHMTRLALTAADEALADAGVDPAELPDFSAGVITASSAGGFEFGQKELQALWSQGGQYVSAYQSFAWFYAVNTGQISIKNGLRGPSGVLVTEQAGGLDAVAQARRQLRKGLRLVVTGGVDSSLCPWGWAAHLAGGELSTSEDPARAFRPFSAEADGHVAGEGGALLVLEDAAAARERGAEIYGTVAGYASTFDPAPGSGGAPRLQAAAELALRDAGLTPADVDVVFADAAGRRDADRAEARALTALFGEYGVPVTAPKTMTGRLAAGGASLDLAAALLSLRDQVIPPTVNTGPAAEDCPVDLVSEVRRPERLRTALVLARGRGGFNAAMVVRAAH
ncbi:Actinorhodin polyketide putative beta-ketoacyl synthase 2 (plasmid) [Streptomyces lavendulae subsp. lavendulae]|uniref:Chain length factor-like protein n=2 Tax=Streptomycetaceae TaxID=2062 RepID=Q93LZ7_KITAU|nr:ketosynthase chain-length factor [Streptomyces lavendulae]AAK61719.1 chain length factor-like protein [Streptomyces lavendulae subsp. lavendulae]AIE41911.1 polyketide beta-ketoacyl synthase, beta subunit [Streptomyces lavendulae subsp. lavendulae]ATZ29865.1 Actinorhodin polyketide putative beta-ketoacyl synthase 2 [Streptomyces lavendulae subsp. lavendulae]